MTRRYRILRLGGTFLLAAAVGFAPGCTLFDDILPGTPFTPDQPTAEVTVQGAINIDRSTGGEGCPAGRALLWGIAKNTGDVDLDDVYIEIDALDAGGAVLGSFRVNVFNGNITVLTEEDDGETTTTPVETGQTAGTSLAVDESGTFAACTTLAYGSVVDTDYRTDYIIVNEIE